MKVNDITILNQKGNLVVGSREVAKNFEKRHDHVLRDIDNIKESGVTQNWGDLFYETTYVHPQNKQEYREILMNRDGFTLLAMGFTGRQALEWKLKYIDAFNEMEEKIKNQAIPTDLSPELQVLINLELKQRQIEQKTEILEHRVNSLDATNIDGTPRQRLNEMVRKYAYDNGLLYPQAWKTFRKSFNTAYGTNIELRKINYQEKHGIKRLTYPEYMERVGLIEDALRVADKMLNRVM